MKVVVINISDLLGGAAIAGYRTAAALKKYYNVTILFLVRSKASKDENIFSTTPNKWAGKLERYFNIFMNALGLQYFYLPISPWFILKTVQKEKPDVIHLHTPVGGYFMLQHMIPLSQVAPIVWTLHDMWAFTASAAHTFGDTSWQNLKSGKNEPKGFPHIGIPTGNYLIKRKKKIYSQTNLTVVVPSLWLYNLAKQSPVLEGKEIVYIPHGLDLEKFKKQDKISVRKKLNLPEDAKVIMFSAQKIKNNEYKGGTDLDQIMEHVNKITPFEIHVLLLGEDSGMSMQSYEKIRVHGLGYIKDENKIIEALNATDIFLYPTKADNLPLVLLEATACGTPCITFNVGGCGDIIKNGFNGYLIEQGNMDQAAKKLVDLLQNTEKLEEFSSNARKHAKENFSDKLMAERYWKLFKKITSPQTFS